MHQGRHRTINAFKSPDVFIKTGVRYPVILKGLCKDSVWWPWLMMMASGTACGDGRSRLCGSHPDVVNRRGVPQDPQPGPICWLCGMREAVGRMRHWAAAEMEEMGQLSA